MDHVARVGVGDRVAGGEDVRDQRDALRGRPTRDDLGQRLAIDPPHHVVRRAVGRAAGVVDRDDAGVLEAGRDPGLALEPRHVHGRVGQHVLDRDRATERAIVGQDHAPHPAPAELAALLEPVRRRIERAAGGRGVLGRGRARPARARGPRDDGRLARRGRPALGRGRPAGALVAIAIPHRRPL